ncbi:MAG: T9SS type A sorting domain-containing protein [Flavobacteriales bacterium]|nr:T9SS type A sorting domain-containing protein [Flavobacteriales bacterium]
MKKSVLLLLGTTLTAMAWGQAARLVINNAGATDPYLVWDPDPRAAQNPGTYLVIDNGNANAITYLGANTTGNFRTEAAQNKIRWNIGATAGVYEINYGNQANVGFPLTVTIGTAPAGPGSFVFSTYSYYPYLNTSGFGGAVAAANAWDNTLYMADAGVTHMNDYNTGLPNNSPEAVDRFWIIDTQEAGYAYATSPTVTLGFEHANNDIQAGNTIIAGTTQLFAQRFNDALNKWGDVLFPGSTYAGGAPTSSVTTVTVGGADFFRAWTLTNRSQPLPVELTSFKGLCDNGSVKLEWTTATESGSDYFTVEKSTDMANWTVVGQVIAAGTSSTQQNYTLVDEQGGELSYYRLLQTDLDGETRYYDAISVGCESANGTQIVSAWDDGTNVNVLVSSTIDVIHDVSLVDLQGRTMGYKAQQNFQNGMTTVSFPKTDIATGIYVFQLRNSDQLLQRRVMIY